MIILKHAFRSATLLGLCLIWASQANAVSISFDLTGSQSVQSSFDVLDSSSLYSLLVTGFSTSGSEQVDRDGNGMGVYSGTGDSEQVDGLGPDETLRFDLGSTVAQIISTTFTLISSGDEFSLTVDGSYKGSAAAPSGTFTYAGTYLGSIFDFGVTDSNDDYKISKVVFDVTSKTDRTEVPEPATMLLLGSGLLGAAVRKRQLTA